MLEVLKGLILKHEKKVIFSLGGITGSGATIISPKLWKLLKYKLTGRRR